MMTPTELLEQSRALILDPDHWTQEVSARDNIGRATLPNARGAVRWCALGALSRIEPDDANPVWSQAYTQLRNSALQLFSMTPIRVNDNLGHDPIIAVFNHAIDGTLPQ